MKVFHLILIFSLIAASHARSSAGGHDEEHEHHESNESCESCEREFHYKCNNNVWLNYMLDAQPAEDGVYFGDLEPGVPIFIGYAELGAQLPGQIQIAEPKGLSTYLPKKPLFLNIPPMIFYLKNDCHHNYTWEASSGNSVVPFAIEPKEQSSNGYPIYYARKVIDGKMRFGYLSVPNGVMIYYDSLGIGRTSTEYEVLTCKSKNFEEPPPPKPTTLAPPSNPSSNSNTGCVHNWQPYIGDDAPARNGIAAGLYDVDNMAYVGKYKGTYLWGVGRVQVARPGNGVYTIVEGKPVNHPTGGYYLVDNPNYHYYWIDSPVPYTYLPNAVYVQIVDSNPVLQLNIGRLQVDGQMHVGLGLSLLNYFDLDGTMKGAESFQILVCDPKPANPCKQEWKPYKNDDAPASNGIKVDYYKDGIVSYIGRSDNKKVFGHDFVVGRVQTSPSNESGVYTLQSVNGGKKFDPYHGEYLVKNSGDLYEWVNAHTGQEVDNALKIPITHASDCCHDGHHKETAYIGRFYLDNVVNIGTVYQRQGLAFVDVNGDKKVVSSFQVLTCASPVKPSEAEEDHHHDCDCDHQCLDEEKFYYH